MSSKPGSLSPVKDNRLAFRIVSSFVIPGSIGDPEAYYIEKTLDSRLRGNDMAANY